MQISYPTVIAWALDIFAPAHCAGCGDPGSDLCPRCGGAILNLKSVVGRAGARAPQAVALGEYDGLLRSVVLALKFRGARMLGARLGRCLAQKIAWPYESIVPVPLHALRQRSRGYNQAAEIAHGIAAYSGAPRADGALVRVRATLPQTELDFASRRANVRDAFAPGREAYRVRGRRVLLVDDVITTGATGSACAAALLSAGARAVYLAALAARL